MSYQTTMVGLIDDTRKFQLLMDNIAEAFEPPVWKKYLTDKFSLSLDWRAILTVLENSPAASVIDFSSGKPLAVRPTASKLNGELASLGNKYQLDKRQVRELLELTDKVGTLGIDATAIIAFLYPDLKRAVLGPHKAIDRLLLEALSTGKMTLTSTLNPKGVVWNAALNWGITTSKVATIWSNIASTPLVDIRAVVDTWLDKGVEFKLMKMSRATFNLMIKTTEFKAAYSLDMGIGADTLKVADNTLFGVDKVNLFLTSVDLPAIELINDPVTIEKKDGTYTTVRPFADNRVSFSVDNNYGEMVRTYANEQRKPNKVKSYAVAENVLISKYGDMDGNEFTEGEFNAFPVINKAKSMAILITDEAAA